MAEWSFLGDLFNKLQQHSPILGRFWLFLMLIFRVVILGTVANEIFEDEQSEFSCNTLQPGCKQVCYDKAFPISQFRFWVLHIVIVSTPSLLFLMYSLHYLSKNENNKSDNDGDMQMRADLRWRKLYLFNLTFRLLSELGFIVGQYQLYGFTVESQFPCSRFPCPYTVDCFTSRPMEKTIFLRFYFGIGVMSSFSSLVELLQVSYRWSRLAIKSQERQNQKLLQPEG